jgi:transcription initiation factor TFIID TATA-box-binding protein
MKMRKPACTAMIRSSGKISITGNKTEEDSKKSAKQVARCLQKLGFNVRFCGYRVNNVLAHVNLSFGIKLNAFAEAHPIVCL